MITIYLEPHFKIGGNLPFRRFLKKKKRNTGFSKKKKKKKKKMKKNENFYSQGHGGPVGPMISVFASPINICKIVHKCFVLFFIFYFLFLFFLIV